MVCCVSAWTVCAREGLMLTSSTSNVKCLLGKFGFSNHQVEQVKQWKRYIPGLINSHILSHIASNMREILVSLVRIYQYITAHEYTCYQSNEVLFTPTHVLTLITHMPCDNVWTRTVHESFMINITIVKGYSESCDVSYIAVYEDHQATSNHGSFNSIIESFCGHVHHQSV